MQAVVQMGVQGQGNAGILSLSSAMPKYQDRYTLVFRRRESLLGSARWVLCCKEPQCDCNLAVHAAGWLRKLISVNAYRHVLKKAVAACAGWCRSWKKV